MKKFKKIMAVLVATIMIVAMAVPAWAETIKITQNPADGTVGPEKYDIYKIFDATKTGDGVGDTNNTNVGVDEYTKVTVTGAGGENGFNKLKEDHAPIIRPASMNIIT